LGQPHGNAQGIAGDWPGACEPQSHVGSIKRGYSGKRIGETAFRIGTHQNFVHHQATPLRKIKEGGVVPHIYKSQTMRWTVVVLMLIVLALLLFEIAIL